MNGIGLLYRELVLGGHLLALGTASMAAAAAFLLGFGPTAALLVMAYLFSFGAYMMNRSAEMDQDASTNPGRTRYLSARRRVLPYVVAASFLIGYAIAATVSAVFFVALLVPLALSLAYSVGSKHLVRVIGTRNLKQRLLLKNISISFGWSLVPILVALYFGTFNLPILLLSPFIFSRLMVNTIFFDVRDEAGDRANGVRTVPTEYGRRKAFSISWVIDGLSALYILALLFTGAYPRYAATLLALPAYSVFYRLIAVRGNANLNFLCDFVADAEYILWGPLIYLGKLLV
jgi:4-hydroxybenzoate polyprenyltransferase